MKRLILAGLLLAALLLSCAVPKQIDTRIPEIQEVSRYHDNCGCLCLSWKTLVPAACMLTYCKDGLCYTSPREDEYTTEHYGCFPERDMEKYTIQAVTIDGRVAYHETVFYEGSQ